MYSVPILNKASDITDFGDVCVLYFRCLYSGVFLCKFYN